MCFLTAVFILALFSGSTHSSTYLKSGETRAGVREGAAGRVRSGFRGATSLRVTLLPLRASGGEVPAGAHGDLQAGGAAAVGQAELQLSGHAVKEGKLGAGAAVAALRRRLRKKTKLNCFPLLAWRSGRNEAGVPRDRAVCHAPSFLQSTRNQRRFLPLAQWTSRPGRCLCFS